MKKKRMLISSVILLLLVLYRILNQFGIQIKNADLLVIVMMGLSILTIYDFVVKFKAWSEYSEEKELLKKEMEQQELSKVANEENKIDSNN